MIAISSERQNERKGQEINTGKEKETKYERKKESKKAGCDVANMYRVVRDSIQWSAVVLLCVTVPHCWLHKNSIFFRE
jgi:hypothetical protein